MSRFLEPAQTPFGGTNDSFSQMFPPEMRRLDYSGDDFTPAGKNPQQLLLRVYQRMQAGKLLSLQEMHWAHSHGGNNFHQQAGVHNERLRKVKSASTTNLEAGANSVDASASHGITKLGFQESKKQKTRKTETTPDPLSDDLKGFNASMPQSEKGNSSNSFMRYGGGGEEDRKSLTSALVVYEINLTEDILTGIFGPFYAKALAGNKKYVKSKSKASFEIPFNKSTNKSFVADHKYGVFFGELKGYADNNLSKVTISAFRDKTNIYVVDPENPIINVEVKGNAEFMSLSQKGQKTEFSVAKAEAKIAYTMNRANLLSKQGMPGYAQAIKTHNPQLYEALERGEVLLDFVFTVSLELDVKGVWEIIEDLDAKKRKEKQKKGHENERDKHKKKEQEAKDSKDSKRKERNKLDDDTRKKEKQLKKLEKNPTDANLEERTRLNTEIDEQKLKSDGLKKDIDKLKDEVEDAREAASKEDKAAKKLKKELNKIAKRVKKKKTPSLRDKLRENLTKENVERITQKVIDKSGRLVEKLSQKVLGKAATQLLKKAVMTAAKLVLRLIPVVGFLIMLWDIVSTIWDIGKAIWDWFTNDDKKEGGGGSDEDGDESNEQSTGDGVDGAGQGVGSGEGTGTGTGSGEIAGSGSGEKSGTGGTVTGGQNTSTTGTAEKISSVPNPSTQHSQDSNTGHEQKPADKAPEQTTDIPVRVVSAPKESKVSEGFSNLQYIAPKSMIGQTLISSVRLEGLFEGDFFSTAAIMQFEYKSVNGKLAYYPTRNYIFVIGGKERLISTNTAVTKIIFR